MYILNVDSLLCLVEKDQNKATDAQNASLKLDKQCLTWSGNSAVVLNAFKIACLAYSPSTVAYRESVYQRNDLLLLK